jgi:tRNA threonylcarbamoyladenosine biosynthesis protein TsaB
MTGLCIDTSGKMLTMALWDESGVLGARSEEAARRHSDLMAEFMNSLLGQRGLSVTDIGAIAVTNGPGSFTGLRVGVSFAKGLAMGLGAKLVALNTLEVLALSSELAEGMVSPMLDAKKKQVYAALYQMSGGGVTQIKEPEAVDPERWLSGLPKGTIVLGSGAAAYGNLIEAEEGRLVFQEKPEEPTPQGLVGLAKLKAAREDFTGWEELDALYIRQADAVARRGR